MKLNITPRAKRKSGMTLLELTVVILVLLSLIAILFVGARAWKKGSDRAANIMNIRNAQQAMRGHANLRNLPQGDTTVTEAVIFGDAGDGVGGYMRKPNLPNTDITAYAGLGTVTPIGDLWLDVTYANSGKIDFAPAAETYKAW